jgi:hypothetical protein
MAFFLGKQFITQIGTAGGICAWPKIGDAIFSPVLYCEQISRCVNNGKCSLKFSANNINVKKFEYNTCLNFIEKKILKKIYEFRHHNFCQFVHPQLSPNFSRK